MTEQKNSSEKTEKTDKSDKASAPKKHSIEPKSARGASTTARRKTAKEADDALQDKIEKARAGAMPERREPAAAGESAGLPPVQTVRAMPQINRKKDETTSDEKAVAKKPSAPVKMPERDATGRFLPSEEKAKKPRAKARAQQARTEDVKKPSEKPEAKPAQKTAQKSEPKETQKAPKQVEPKVETKTESQPAQKTQEAKAAKKPEGPVTSAAPAAPVPHVKPVLSLLMDEAPSGVMTDMKADDRPAPGEVRGKPADETNEAPSSPVLRPSGNRSPNGSRIIDIEGEEDEEEDYDDIPDPAVSVSESADDDEIDDDEPDDDDDQSSADRPVKKPVSVISPAAEDPEPVELDSQGRPYHATEVLSGRRTPVRVKPPVEEPADPSRTVDLAAERIDAEHTARQALLRLHARTQPTRAELASMLVSKKIEQMERGNPAFEKDPSQEGDSDSVPDRNEDARSKGWNSLWENGVRDAAAEQNALVDVRRPPRYAFDEDERPQVERDEAYARRMDAWEKDVMAESESRDQRVSCRGPKPGPRVPVRTGTHETLGGFPTPHQTRAWKAEGGEEEERESRLDIIRERLNRLHERWSGLEGCLRAALAVACVSSVAAFAAWTTAKSVVPDLTVSNVAVEPGEQFYERALRRRIRSWPDVSAAGFLTVELSQYLKGTGGATAEAVMAALLRLGHDGLVANGRRLASRLDTLTVSEARDVLEACGLAAERHARAMTRACEKDPEGISEREARERALCPAVTARLTGTYHAIPWDARHDGHLASREVSRAAGLVRWAHALTSERSSRVHLAVGRSLLFGRGAADVWKHRRPLVFIDRINAYTVKLVTDCWTADPQTAVVYAGDSVPATNPFDAWAIPLVVDTRGFLRALLAVDKTPCLIEPRLGGFTVTFATGRVDPKGFRDGEKLAPWMKTLAEIGLINAYDEAARAGNVPAFTGAEACVWAERFKSLLSVTLALDNSARRGLEVDEKALEAAARQRENYVAVRNEMTSILEKLADGARELREAELAQRAERRAKQREERKTQRAARLARREENA